MLDTYSLNSLFSSCVLRDVLNRLELPSVSCAFSYWTACFATAKHPNARVFCLRALAFTL